MDLSGTVKTPFGPISKKTALIGGGGLVVVAGIVWYRQKQTADLPDANAAEAEIDPATGFPYGSAEDAAALAAQAAYVSPSGNTGGGGGGSSGSSDTPTYASTNAEWVQLCLSYFQDNGMIEDISQLSAALGKYIAGAYIVPGSAENSLIQQAIAVRGQPPTAATNGYPPSINTTPPSSGGGTTPPPDTTPTAGPVGPIKGRKTTSTVNTITSTFTAAANAVSYVVYLDGRVYKTISVGPVTIGALLPNTHHTVGIQPVGSNGAKGPISNTTMWTKKK